MDTNDKQQPPPAVVEATQRVAELAAEGDPNAPEEVHGVYLSARVVVQCVECGTVLEPVEFVNSDTRPGRLELDDHVVECPTCTKAAGHQVVIPIFILAGEATSIVPDDDDDEKAAPEGHGQPV